MGVGAGPRGGRVLAGLGERGVYSLHEYEVSVGVGVGVGVLLWLQPPVGVGVPLQLLGVVVGGVVGAARSGSGLS